MRFAEYFSENLVLDVWICFGRKCLRNPCLWWVCRNRRSCALVYSMAGAAVMAYGSLNPPVLFCSIRVRNGCVFCPSGAWRRKDGRGGPKADRPPRQDDEHLQGDVRGREVGAPPRHYRLDVCRNADSISAAVARVLGAFRGACLVVARLFHITIVRVKGSLSQDHFSPPSYLLPNVPTESPRALVSVSSTHMANVSRFFRLPPPPPPPHTRPPDMASRTSRRTRASSDRGRTSTSSKKPCRSWYSGVARAQAPPPLLLRRRRRRAERPARGRKRRWRPRPLPRASEGAPQQAPRRREGARKRRSRRRNRHALREACAEASALRAALEFGFVYGRFWGYISVFEEDRSRAGTGGETPWVESKAAFVGLKNVLRYRSLLGLEEFKHGKTSGNDV